MTNAAYVAGLGSYLPACRLELAEIAAASAGAPRTGSIAVCDADEDAVTMAVAACELAMDAAGTPPETVDKLVMATSSSPFAEHSAAAEVSRALALRSDVSTVDLAASARGGILGLRAAADAVVGRSANRVLVVGSDMRYADEGSPLHGRLGGGAAAALIDTGGQGIRLGAVFSCRHGVPSVWRLAGAATVQGGADPRFEATVNAAPAVASAVAAAGAGGQVFSFVAGPDPRLAAVAGRAAGGEVAVVGPARFNETGSAGCADSLLALAAAWSRAAPADLGVVVAYESGAGAEAMVVEAISDASTRCRLASSPRFINYLDYLRLRQATQLVTPAPAPWPTGPEAAREAPYVYELTARRCRRCGSLNFPRRSICIDCRFDEFDEVPLPREGELVTWNRQYIAAIAPEPLPVVIGVARVDEAGGGRGGQVSAMVVASPGVEPRIGLPVRLVFRRVGEESGVPKYGWKFEARPGKGQS